MSSFVLAWVLMSMDIKGGVTYSPAVISVEDCQRMETWVRKHLNHPTTQCIQVVVMRGGK
jgi:hypothetical protein